MKEIILPVTCRNYEFLGFISYSYFPIPRLPKTRGQFVSCLSVFLWFEDKYICPQGALKHRLFAGI